MASYEKFDYSTRPNKRTQRKMIFDALARYIGVFPRTSFHYVGFGSMWFADFLYAHRRQSFGSITITALRANLSRTCRISLARWRLEAF